MNGSWQVVGSGSGSGSVAVRDRTELGGRTTSTRPNPGDPKRRYLCCLHRPVTGKHLFSPIPRPALRVHLPALPQQPRQIPQPPASTADCAHYSPPPASITQPAARSTQHAARSPQPPPHTTSTMAGTRNYDFLVRRSLSLYATRGCTHNTDPASTDQTAPHRRLRCRQVMLSTTIQRGLLHTLVHHDHRD